MVLLTAGNLIKKTIAAFIILLIIRPFAFGQNSDEPGRNSEFQDSLKTDQEQLKYPIKDENRYPFSNSGIYSPLYLKNPSNIKTEIVYDPVTNQYIFTEKIGRIDYRPPSVMTFKEFQQYEQDASVRNNWISKSRGGSSAQGSTPIGKIRMGESFNKVFGTDAINIVPQGSAELIFAYNISRNDNPQLSERNRRNGAFTFKEKIQMNVTGSIGDKMQLGINYDTEATFDFENKTKLEYAGKEDEIIKKIEAGNVTFPLTGSLISGSQSLFGIKTELQFGKLTVTSVFSHQRGESEVINVQGGAQVNEFEVPVDEYDANRHFFLSHFFRNNYNEWLGDLPYITSGVRIEQIEVWVTNKNNDFTANNNNIVAFMDLGEAYYNIDEPNFYGDPDFIQPVFTLNTPVSNDANSLYNTMTGNFSAIRSFENIASSLSVLENQYSFVGGIDYEKIESARKLTEREYTVNRELGYISLNSSLRNDEILAVAYVYTYKGKTYRVGELSTDGIEYPNTLILKLLKGTNLSPKYKTWDLMMKNIYSIGAYQVNSQDFKLDVLYRNDKTGVPTNYINDPVLKSYPSVDSAFNNRILLRVMNLDNLDTRSEPNPDGMFDFIEGVTINPTNGKIIFPMVEPFGSDLLKIVEESDPGNQVALKIAGKYIYQELYDSTQTKAQQIAEKNKFFLAGTYQSSGSSEIQLNAMNVPRGSVKVSAGGIQLTENVDYSVDYTLGRVKIINTGLLESGTPLRISLENNALFNLQTKTLVGTHLDYKFSDNFNIGGTIMNLTERPLTQKVNIGDEPISNTIWGLNTSYRTESNLLTTLIDKLPLIETKEVSSITFDAEFAHLIPGQAKAIGKGGVAYIDDFEGTETSIELKNRDAWVLASTPRTLRGGNLINNLEYNYGRAKIAWYNIDPLFTTKESKTPGHINTNQTSDDNYVRQIYENEIYKEKESGLGITPPLTVLNLAYFPGEKGPYNYDTDLSPDGYLNNPGDRWGGIMREINTNDFETANVGFIEFWLMDPYFADTIVRPSGGDLYFNLGEVSEDILRDSRKSFENGLPDSDTSLGVDTTNWGRVPNRPSYTPSFNTSPESRQYQDIGLDGLNDEQERIKFAPYLDQLSPDVQNKYLIDPSNDNFHYFLGGDLDAAQTSVIGRYKNYNGLEGNSPSSEQSGGEYRAESNLPDVEDINRDNTLNENESYFSYKVKLRPENMNIGENFIVSKITGKEVNWYQFRIPITDFDSKFGNIEDFKSIRFIRMYLHGFQDSVILRFAELRLIRNEWRKYGFDLNEGSPSVTQEYESGSFEISAVNIEENSDRYLLPPGIDRVIDPSQPQLAQLNEQSMVMKVYNLKDGEARVAYKNTELDLRQYKKLTMWVHAENLQNQLIDSSDLTAFIRIGSDYKDNFYEYEIPLNITDVQNVIFNDKDSEFERQKVWPNKITIDLNEMVNLKIQRDEAVAQNSILYSKEKLFERRNNSNAKVKVRGTPNLSNIRTIMIGVRNPSGDENDHVNDGLPKTAEIWFNELRLEDFNNKGGWAANARVQAKLADVGTLSVAGSTIQPGFGSIEQKVDEREKEQLNQVDISSNLELGKLFPEKSKVSVPMFIGISKSVINPEYYPKDPDRLLKDVLDDAETKAEKKAIKKISQDLTERMSLNFTNVRVSREFKKFKPLSPGNFSLSTGYSEVKESSYKIEYNNIVKYNLGLNYNFVIPAKNIVPFKKSKSLKSPYFKIIKDFNFIPYPSRFTYSTNFDRYYSETKLRNVTDYDIKIDSTINKDFIWNRNYNVQWDFTRGMKFSFNASTLARIYEPGGATDLFKKNDREQWRDSVWQNIKDGGSVSNYNHNLNFSYTLPINKFPAFNWLTTTITYSAKFDWKRGPVYYDDKITDKYADKRYSLGHYISNSNTTQYSGQVNMTSVYNKIPYLKKIDAKYKSNKKGEEEKRYKTVTFSKRTFVKANQPKSIIHKLGTQDIITKITDSEGNELNLKTEIINENKIEITADKDYSGITVDIEGQIERGMNPLVFISDNSIRFLTGLKNFNVSYSVSGGTMFLGYKPEAGFLGFGGKDNSVYDGAPGLLFLMGWQDPNFVRKATKEGWVTRSQDFTNPYTMTMTENFRAQGLFEPFRGFKLDISGLRTYSKNTSEYFIYNPQTTNEFDFSNRVINGNFSISVITISSAFEKIDVNDNYLSASFEKFKENRKIIASRLYSQRVNEGKLGYQGFLGHSTEDGYPDGYNSVSPEVIIPAFLAAYTGKDPNKVNLENFPGYKNIMPNWKLSFDGLSRINFFKKFFKSITISHSYQSVYSIGSYTNYVDLIYESDGLSYLRDYQDNFYPDLLVSAVSINEKISPLIGINITWNNNLSTRFEIAKSRILAVSLSNNQLAETRNNDIIIGAGYRFVEVPLMINEKLIKSDLNLRFDLTVRDNKVLLRNLSPLLDENQADEMTNGQKVFKIGFTADYALSPRFNVQFFFDRTLNKPHTSRTNLTADTNIGFSLRFTLQ